MLFRLAPATALLSLLSVVHAGTFNRPVVNLDARSFDKEVLKEDKTSMVVFYAPWCGHCKNLGPEYEKAAASLSPIVPFYAVDCDDAGNRNLCAKYDVKGFPTLKLFTRGGKIPPRDYQGERKSGPLISHASQAVTDRVKKLKVPSKGAVDGADAKREVEAFLAQDSNKPHLLLVHPVAASVPLLYKSLSQRYSNDFAFGYLRDADFVLKGLLNFDVAEKTRPKLLTWKAGAGFEEVEPYEGALKFEPLATYLSGGPVEPYTPSATSSFTTAVPNATALKRAEERAKAQKKWEEEERRDRERRAKLEAKRAAAAAAAAAVGAEDEHVEETMTEGTAVDPQEARPPTPAAEEAVAVDASAADPVPEASSEASTAAHQKDEL